MASSSGRTGSTSPLPCVRSHGLSLGLSSGRTGSTSPTPCTVTTPCAAARLVVRSHWLYPSYTVCRDYSMRRRLICCPVALALHRLRRAPRVLVARLHQLYRGYAVHPDALSHGSTSHRSVALALVVRPVTPSPGSTTRRPVAPALLRLCRASGQVFAA
jgi:hypothetical protein